MNETAVRELMRRAMDGAEPPPAPQIIGGAVRGAKRIRRRQQVAGIGVATVTVTGLALGVPAVIGALSPAAAGHPAGPGTPGARVTKTVTVPSVLAEQVARAERSLRSAGLRFRVQLRPAQHGVSWLVTEQLPVGGSVVSAGSEVTLLVLRADDTAAFVRPKLPVSSPDPDPVAITNQSVGQLLLDDLPAGAHPSQIEASADANAGSAGVIYRTADAWLNEVTTPIGSGNVQADMMQAGPTAVDFGCLRPGPGSDVPCRIYRLAGGVEVAEQYIFGVVRVGPHTGQHFEQLDVSVFRPDVAEMSVSEGDSAMTAGSPVTKGVPLTLTQLLKIALDSRWQFTISSSFVQQASGLHVAPLDTAGS
jgi:PASTA domain